MKIKRLVHPHHTIAGRHLAFLELILLTLSVKKQVFLFKSSLPTDDEYILYPSIFQ